MVTNAVPALGRKLQLFQGGAVMLAPNNLPQGLTFRSLAAALKDWAARRELRRSMAQMGHGDRERVLAEFGLSRSEFDRMSRTPFVSQDLLSPMMSAVGLDSDRERTRQPALMRDLERVCTTCRSRRRCRRSLVSGHAARAYREFCPNAATFDRFIADGSWAPAAVDRSV